MRRFVVYPNMKTACVAALLLAAFVTGCAGLRWHKDGADPAALDRDLGECQAQARMRSAREAGPVALPRPGGVDARGRIVMDRDNRHETDRVLLEHDLTRACMRGKGYDLVPVRKEGDS